MANILVKHGVDDIYNKASGTGSNSDPHIPVVDVNIQDQTSPVLIVPFHSTTDTTTLTAATAKDDVVFNVTDATGFVAGEYLTAYNVAGGRWYQGRIISVAALAVTIDTPIDFEYQIGDSISVGSVHLNVNGAVTPQIFSIRLPDPGIPIVGDITRIILVMTTTLTPEWDKFGDLTALTNGIVLRKTDGSYMNIFNAKSNAELSAIMYDLDFLELAKFGVAGVKGRLTFGGQNKIGVTVRLAVGEDLEIIVQDNLTGLLDFTVLAEGHVVV